MRDRIANIRRWFEYRWRRVRRLPLGVLGVLVGMAIVSSVAGFWGTEQGWKGLWQNLGPELVGAVVTYVLIDLVLGTRQRKEALIAQMGSYVRDVAVSAVEEVRRQGWFTDGSLREAKLWRANLKGANLTDADLEGAGLVGANLEEAGLVGANLKEANLGFAHLQGAMLVSTHLEGAEITAEQLAQACLLGGATLPDGTKLSEDNWEAVFEQWRKRQEEQGSGD